MGEPSFELLTQRLLKWGIAPKHARRLRRELQDHYDDLQQDALRTADSPEAAAAEARLRLGAEEAIAGEFLRRPELRSWCHRAGFTSACSAARALLSMMLPTLGRFAVASAGAVVLMAGSAFLIQLAMNGALRISPDLEPLAAIGRVELLDRPRDAAPAASANRGAPSLERPSRLVPPERPSYPENLDPWPPSPTLQIAAVAPQAGVAPPLFRLTDGDLLPIVRVAPVFPVRAAAQGLEGYVVIEYTVTRAGAVVDVVVVESSNSIFEQPALEAAGKFRYRPRVVGGQPVAVHGVRTRMSFVLDV